uniref:Acyl-CoA thioesterase-like N-terminal HotDog domain-containing protein n=1 Tax=Kryptolebias marmoratus TaxID=37003 RepID=A0A3Q3FDX9_KRYMA
PDSPQAGNSAGQAPQDLRSVLVTSVLNLEKLDHDLYRGTHHWVPRTQRLFGGQIIGQALVAAAKSVCDNLYAHSIHCYFVRAGKMSKSEYCESFHGSRSTGMRGRLGQNVRFVSHTLQKTHANSKNIQIVYTHY